MPQNIPTVLCSTLDDPEAVLLDNISVAATAIKLDYPNWVVRTTSRTDERVIGKLKALGVIVVSARDDSTPIVEDQIENDHLLALKHGLSAAQNVKSGVVQYMDGDRAIMAAKYFPNDFTRLAEIAQGLGTKHKNLGYLNIRRTQKDFLDHHPSLTNTEQVFNYWYSQVFGMPIDMGSTTTIMTPDVIEMILTRSSAPDIERVNFPQPLWLIIAKEMGAHIYSDEIQNVLTYEAPEQNRAKITDADMKSVNEAQSPAQR